MERSALWRGGGGRGGEVGVENDGVGKAGTGNRKDGERRRRAIVEEIYAVQRGEITGEDVIEEILDGVGQPL